MMRIEYKNVFEAHQVNTGLDMEKNNRLKIAVIGPGAVGCLLAHGLAVHGCDVTLLDYRADRAERLSRIGIRVKTSNGMEVSSPVCTSNPVTAGHQDAVIFAVKAFQTESAAAFAAAMVDERCLIITLQNGMGYEKSLVELGDADRFVAGVTALGATLIGEGEVVLAGRGKTVLGFTGKPCEVSMHIFQRLVHVFEIAGWDIESVDDPGPSRWKKLMVNVGINAITALTCIRNGEILEYKDAMELQDAAVREAFAVMSHHCAGNIYEYEKVIQNVRAICRFTRSNISSMLQDRRRRGFTEIDYINGYVCKLGALHGISVPVNSTLLSLIRIMSATEWRSCDSLGI